MKPEKRTAAPGTNGRGSNRGNETVSNYHIGRETQEVWPDELASKPVWCTWRGEPNPKNPDSPIKMPYNANTGRRPKKEDGDWGSTRDKAEALWKRLKPKYGLGGGVGTVLGLIHGEGGNALGGLDQDSCRDPETGKIEKWARKIMRRLDYIYWEVSPSGTGVKGYFLHQTPGKKIRKFKRPNGKAHPPAIETYHDGRYFAFTGKEVKDRLGNSRPIAMIKPGDSDWLENVAGPEFESDGIESASSDKKEKGRSEALLEYAAFAKAEGYSYEEYREKVEDECPDGYDHALDQKNPERAIERAWDRSADPLSEDEFEDLGPDANAKPHFVDELNQKHAVVRTGGKTVIADLKPEGVDFGSVGDLNNLYANRRAAKGEGRTVPVSELWMQHKKRRTYEGGVDFDPSGKCGPDTLNLWTGFAVKPNPEASCDLIKQHIHRVVAKGNRDHAAYVFGWLAHMVQRPGEKPGVALVLRGAKGAGKDTVAEVMARIIGRKHCPTVADKNQLTGRFNAHFAAALLLQVQEGVWAGDRQAESPLKSLVTSEWIAIERKGIDVINIKSCMRLIITSNAEWVVPASADERRWAIFEVSDKRCNDREYFDALYAEINGDGPGAFLHYLQNYDLTDFDVRKLPDTDGLLNQRLASLRDFERYWLNALREGRVADSRDWEGGEVTVGRSDLVDDYNQHAKESRFGAEHLDERQIGRALHKLCPGITTKRGKRDSSRRRVYVIPDLDSCRAAFDAFIGREVNWDE